jgi:hypothetical protein
MKTYQAITALYKNLNNHFGPSEARETVAVILANVIGRLQDEGLSITEKNIAAGLEKAADDYKHQSKSDVA